MPFKSARAAIALLVSTAVGCQEMHTLSKYDPLIRADRSSRDVSLASAEPGGSKLHLVGYAPGDGPGAATSAAMATSSASPAAGGVGAGPLASGPGAVGSDGDGATLNLASATASNAAKPSWLGGGGSSPSGKSWNDLFVTRGQGPLRDVYISDRALIAAVVIAAIVIPFAIHDSRQPNPPHQ